MIILELIFAFILAILMRIIMANGDEETEKVEPEAGAVKILIETINGSYYAWHFEDNEFIAQSSSKVQIVEELKKKFPNKNLNLLSKEKIEWLQENKN